MFHRPYTYCIAAAFLKNTSGLDDNASSTPSLRGTFGIAPSICRVESLLSFSLSVFEPENHGLVCKAVELVYEASGKQIVPRYEQLDCPVRLPRRDIIYIAATGSGKMLILAMLLNRI